MRKEDFKALFLKALDLAASNLEAYAQKKVPRRFEILFYGLNFGGVKMTVEDAFDVLFIDEETFHPIVDLAVMEVTEKGCVVFLRVADYQVGSFDKTWNEPSGQGPFKQLIAIDVKWPTP